MNIRLMVRTAVCGIFLVILVAMVPSQLWGAGNGDSPPLQGEGQGGDGLSSADILKRVQATYRDVNDFTADFVQQSYIQGFDAKNFKGKLYLKKPGLVRWDYIKPVKQNIIINGETITLYFHEQKQAIIQKVSDHPDAEPAMGLLSNIEKWEDNFIVKSGEPSSDFFRLKLAPRTMMMVKEVIVEIDKETSYIKKLTLTEDSGNKVSFSFSGTKFNSGIKNSLFDFKIPGGTEVLKY